MPRDVELIPGATSTLRRRISVKIVRTGGRRACWSWLGGTARHRGGRRPKIQIGGRGSRTMTVARLLLVLRDRVPLISRELEKLEAGHRCHHYWCVNTAHLEWSTRIDNEHAKYEFDARESFVEDIAAIVDDACADELERAAS